MIKVTNNRIIMKERGGEGGGGMDEARLNRETKLQCR